MTFPILQHHEQLADGHNWQLPLVQYSKRLCISTQQSETHGVPAGSLLDALADKLPTGVSGISPWDNTTQPKLPPSKEPTPHVCSALSEPPFQTSAPLHDYVRSSRTWEIYAPT